MIVERTVDENVIMSVLDDPEIKSCIAEDGVRAANLDVGRLMWLNIISSKKTIGVFMLEIENSITLSLHAHMLPKHRNLSRDAGIKVYEWLIENSTFKKITAEIPEIYGNVIDYALLNGFKKEGVNRQSYLKNGEVHNQINMGITRSEIERFLDGFYKRK